ncbi:GNAT family N-acetyltransferase [Candidatus Leptofilum sp.]|uniref:GNAT family N-acetyltransferase n=1 Tax=Candidatus Leptofilum sp. TaxID=3241576 RepID=UPI003B595372
MYNLVLERVRLATTELRQMVEAYWLELMPHSDVAKSPENREAYFQERFPLEMGEFHLYFAVVGGENIGFVALRVKQMKHAAMIEDFYVVPKARRQGYGSAMVKAVYTELDQLGVELIELTVRRDTPQALAFWEAQGFRVALHRLRQYRDPNRGIGYVGALSSDFD